MSKIYLYLQVLELAGDPLPDVGRTQPYHHRRPRHQHRHLCSIGKQQLSMIGNLKKKKLQVWYCPNASERPPWPATLAAAIGLFLYQVDKPVYSFPLVANDILDHHAIMTNNQQIWCF